MFEISKERLKKFDIEGPRYTSYPTAPEWEDAVDDTEYGNNLKKFGESSKALSLYVHIPFCKTLCLYCGCMVNIKPVNSTDYAETYLKGLIKEVDLLAEALGTKKTINQFHIGGGTPNYFNEGQLEKLTRHIRGKFTFGTHAEVAIEIDPRTVSAGFIKSLKTTGFNRVSMGVQDFDERVQRAVNRIQSYEQFSDVYTQCRDEGFPSINVDLIYGLPYQTLTSFKKTIEKIIALRPDRIALYSYAYLPWLKKHQRSIKEETLPTVEEKLEIFLQSRHQLLEAGYDAIAMDHFALKADELSKAFKKGVLFRNFMGYTVKMADEYVGLGVSSIGFLNKLFVQNVKSLDEYYRLLGEGKFPIQRGKRLTADDEMRRWVITQLMCRFGIDKKLFLGTFGKHFDEYFSDEKNHLEYCQNEGLIVCHKDTIEATGLGKLFIRNVCMGFDEYLKQKSSQRRFSRTI